MLRRLLAACALAAAPTATAAAQVPGACPGTTEAVCPYVAAAEFGDSDPDLRFPQAVGVDPQGRVVVGDQLGNALRRFDLTSGRAERIGWLGRPRDQRVGGVGGLAVGPDGLIYVADAGNSAIDVLAPDGRELRTFGRGQLILISGGRQADNTAGGDVAVAGDEVFVANTGGDTVTVFDARTGARKRVLGEKGRARLDAPQGLDVHGNRLLIADTLHRRVVELTLNGRFVRESPANRFRSPYDVAFASGGGAVVADNTSHRVVQVDRRLRPSASFGAGRLTFPRSLTVDSRGRTIVTDSAGGRVLVFDRRGRPVRTLGRPARREGALSHPTGLALAPDGGLLVADTGASRITRWTVGGRALGTWGGRPQLDGSHDPGTYESPYGIGVAADGRVAVTDRSRVQLLDARGRFERQVTDISPMWDPGIPVFEPDGTLWVPDRGFRSRVDLFARDLRRLRQIGGEPFGRALTDFSRPAAVARRPDATLVVADPNKSRVAIVDPRAGRVTSEIRSPLLSRPTAVAVGASGTIYVSDAIERVVLIRPDGSISAFGEAGRGIGQLSGVRGIAVSCSGELLVSDQFNNRVQRFRLRDEPVTCAGGPGTPARFPAPPRPPVVSTRLTALPPLTRPGRIRWSVRCSRRCSVTRATLRVGRSRPEFRDIPSLEGARTLRRVARRTTSRRTDLTFRLSSADVALIRRHRRLGRPVLLRLEVQARAGVYRATRASDRAVG